MATVDEPEASAATGEPTASAPAQTTEPSAAPDPAVSVALAVGWQMAHLYRHSTPKASDDAGVGEKLPGISDLDPARRTQLALMQVKAGLHTLKERLAVGGLAPPSTVRVEEAYEGGSAAELKGRVSQLHLELLQGLNAGDFRLGKAYSLGRALADTCRAPSSLRELQTAFEYHRIGGLQEFLVDLDSLFPRHAGRAVSLSLDDWRRWAATPYYGEDPLRWNTHGEAVRQSLARQAPLWRGLLAGEKDPTDTLAVDDYIEAADRMSKEGGKVVRKLASRYQRPLLIVVVIFLVAVVMVAESNGDAAQVVAAIGAGAAALGVSWKGVGSALATVGEHLREPLWGVELDRAIAVAITRLPAPPVPDEDREIEVAPSGPLRSTLDEAL